MAIGSIDGWLSDRVLEGWATDPVQPLSPVGVVVLDAERNEIASGYANLYREDLGAVPIGLGWCGFRLIASRSVSSDDLELSLVDGRSQDILFGPQKVARKPAPLADQQSIGAVVASDPTALRSIDQLKPCTAAFAEFIALRGVSQFIRHAYVYMLQRPADAGALAHYENMLSRGELEPFAVLKNLSESDEFKSRARILAAPTSDGFPFKSR